MLRTCSKTSPRTLPRHHYWKSSSCGGLCQPPPPYLVRGQGFSAPQQRLRVSGEGHRLSIIAGHRSVRDRDGVIAVINATHGAGSSRLSWEREMNLNLSYQHIPLCWPGHSETAPQAKSPVPPAANGRYPKSLLEVRVERGPINSLGYQPLSWRWAKSYILAGTGTPATM